MSVQNDILAILNERGQPAKSSELAEELKKPSSTIRGETTRLKQKGYIDGNSQEGWLITDAGRKEIEKGIHPSMVEEGVTPRQKFEAIAQRIGIKEDRIALAADIVWSGDYADLKWVWEALGQADIRDDLRKVWVNAWRAFLHKGIPPELEIELTGQPETDKPGEGVQTKASARDFIIVDEQPVRVGPNLGDYSLQDAKDILAIRALRGRFGGAVAQAGAGQGPPGAAEKLSDVITALGPFLKQGADIDTMKEIIGDKLELQRREILGQIQSGQPGQPKSGIEQITDFVAAMSSLKDVGPTLRSILGIPESSSNPNPGLPVQVTGPDGKPLIMDMGQVIDWQKFQAGERRADGSHQELMSLSKTVRENIPDGIKAIMAAASEAKTESKPVSTQPQAFKCGDCGTEFKISAEILNDPRFESATCENCGRKWTKEELMA